jgi:hypothetical protein
MWLENLVRTIAASAALLLPINQTYLLPQTYAQDAQPQKQERKSLDELPILKKNRTTFEQAKKASDSTKIKYLDMLLVEGYQLIKDAKRNPDGFVPAWYYWPDKAHQKKAIEAITDEAKHGGQVERAQRHIAVVQDLLPQRKIWPRHKGSWGHEKNMTYLLIDQTIFDLNSEDELLSTLDKAYATLYAREYGVQLKEGKMDTKNSVLTFHCGEFIDLYAKRLQVENILRGNRKSISDAFKEEAFSNFMKAYENIAVDRKTDFERYIKIKFGDKEVDNSNFKTAYDAVVKILKETDESLLKLGYKIDKGSIVKADVKESDK